MQDGNNDRIRKVVHTEVMRALQEHSASMAAHHRSMTPAPIPSTPTNPKVAQQQVQTLISQCQFNLAFKTVI